MNIAILVFIISILFIIGILIYKYWTDIYSFFYPSKFIEIEMIELDNNCSNWLQKKNDKLTFDFNKGTYKMFTGEFDKKQPSIYRSGRLAKMFYLEGNEYPLDIRLQKITGNPQLTKQLAKIDVSELWNDDMPLHLELIKKYLPFLLLGIFILIIIFRTGG